MELRKLFTTNLSGLVLGQNYDTSKQKTITWKGPRYRRKRPQMLDLLYVTDQLGGLVRANAPLVQGITDALSLDAPNGRIEAVLLTLRDDLAAGMSITEAMRLRPRFFPGGYVDLVAAGEESGALVDVFSQLSDEIDRDVELSGAWTGYLSYAGLVIAIQLALLSFQSVKVTPVFIEILDDFAGGYPRSILIMDEIGQFISIYWSGILSVLTLYLILAVAIHFAGGWRLLSGLLGGLFAQVPFVRAYLAKRQLARAGYFLSRLLASGVSLDEALARIDTLAIQKRWRRAFARARERVVSGESFSSALEAERRVWPASFRSWVALGERSALLPDALKEVAQNYSEQCLKTRAMATRAFAPLLLLGAGALSLFGTLAFFETYGILIESQLSAL